MTLSSSSSEPVKSMTPRLPNVCCSLFDILQQRLMLKENFRMFIFTYIELDLTDFLPLFSVCYVLSEQNWSLRTTIVRSVLSEQLVHDTRCMLLKSRKKIENE